MFEFFWYPLGATFLYDREIPNGVIVFEYVSIGIFYLDMLMNMRTTYSNENNEEIIDSKMMLKNYLTSKWFWIDFIAALPLSEFFFWGIDDRRMKYNVYSILKLVKVIRLFKIESYLQYIVLGFFWKIFKIFVMFFIIVLLLFLL